MKVLWFSNTPALAIHKLNEGGKLNSTGGWLYTMNALLQNEVELAVAFHYPYKLNNFVYDKTQYFPLYSGNIFIELVKSKISRSIPDDRFLKQYLKVIEDFNPDVIHIHGTENSFLCIIEHTNKPVVVSIQGILTVIGHKYLSGIESKYLKVKSNFNSLRTLILGRDNFKKDYINLKLRAELEKKYLPKINYFIGRTNWDKSVTQILSRNSIYFKNDEIMREEFFVNQWKCNFEKDKIVIFTTSGNSYFKGVETICQAINILKNNTRLLIKWHVAGITNESLITKVVRKFMGEDYPDKEIVLIGSLDGNHLVNEMLNANIYVMPSHIENSPNNLCEAMLIGMPCISSFVGGTSTILKNEETGLIFQDGDPWSLASMILELYNNQDEAIKLGSQARKIAHKRHEAMSIINKQIEIYQEVTLLHAKK